MIHTGGCRTAWATPGLLFSGEKTTTCAGTNRMPLCNTVKTRQGPFFAFFVILVVVVELGIFF